MIIVKSEKELNKAVKDRKKHIVLVGPLAKKYIDKAKDKGLLKEEDSIKHFRQADTLAFITPKFIFSILALFTGAFLANKALEKDYDFMFDIDGNKVEFRKKSN